MIFIYGTHVYLQVFFSFIQNFDFLGVVRGVKGQNLQKDRNFCPSHSISQEPTSQWLSLLAHKCKMISSGIFFIFSTRFFFGWSEGKIANNDPKWLKVLLVYIYIYIYIYINKYVYMYIYVYIYIGIYIYTYIYIYNIYIYRYI